MSQDGKINPIPPILGADFDPSYFDITKYDEMIKSAPTPKEPIRILFDTEATFLNTGFSVYAREVLKKLHENKNIVCAEIASYGANRNADPRAAAVPWKYYPVLPENGEEAKQYASKPDNQFGVYKLDYVLCDFKPDIVIAHRDNWMARHINSSVFRNNFLFYWLICCDSYPQRWDWLKDYNKLDKAFGYSFFGKRVIEDQSRFPIAKLRGIKPIDVHDVMPVPVNTEVFRPIDKKEVKQIFGIPDNLRFVGTVMRNQPRKLFPRIIESFRMMKKAFEKDTKNVMLLLHTSIPDVGWDIPELIQRNGLEQHVVMSYLCTTCHNIGISSFIGSPTNCPSCGNPTFQTPTTQYGYEEKHLNLVYNLMDIYIQGSIAEGCGGPVQEAKAAGVPTLVSDYSALYEKARNGGAKPIQNDTLWTESETMQWRSYFDRKDLMKKMHEILTNRELRLRMSREARECAVKYYDVSMITRKWEAHILNSQLKDRDKTWNAPIEIKTYTQEKAPKELSNKEFIEWCYKNILGRNGVDNEGMKTWSNALGNGAPRDSLEQHFRKIVDDENDKKKKLANKEISGTNPIDNIRKQIEFIESND